MTLDQPGEENPNTEQGGAPGPAGSQQPPPKAPASADDISVQARRLSLRTGDHKRSSAAEKRRAHGGLHGLELVTSTASQPERTCGTAATRQAPAMQVEGSGAEESSLTEEDPHHQAAARMMQAIEDEVEQIRRGAGRVIRFQPAAAPQRFGQRAGRELSRLQAAVRRFARNPLAILAGLVSLGLAAAATLRRYRK